VIGARNRIREGVTMNTGTEHGGGVTRVGDDGLFMAGAHVAHDAQIGNRVILVNNASIAGHCVIDDDVIVGGLSGVHQWVRVGRGAIIGAVTMVANDVIPYGLVQGPRGVLDGLNLVGLKRRGVDRADITALGPRSRRSPRARARSRTAPGALATVKKGSRLRARDRRVRPGRHRPLLPDAGLRRMGARAIIAGKGALPGLLLAEAPAHVVAFAGVEVQAEGLGTIPARFERLGALFDELTAHGSPRSASPGPCRARRSTPPRSTMSPRRSCPA
jgi:carbonic anhydrase/acetyltransferase-like protein (isoleucine patch superfamily)